MRKLRELGDLKFTTLQIFIDCILDDDSCCDFQRVLAEITDLGFQMMITDEIDSSCSHQEEYVCTACASADNEKDLILCLIVQISTNIISSDDYAYNAVVNNVQCESLDMLLEEVRTFLDGWLSSLDIQN